MDEKCKPTELDVIVTIVVDGRGEDVLHATRQAGAHGGTIINGRGIGIHETKKILGIPIEPRKDIVLTVTPSRDTQRLLSVITEAVNLNAPGNGIGLVIPLKYVTGMPHMLIDDGYPDS